MSVLVITCLSAGLLDSLNPSAIAQMMLIETMVRKKKNVWFFMLGIGLANFVLGLLILYGIVNVLESLLSIIVERHAGIVSSFALILSLALLIAGTVMLIKVIRKGSAKNENQEVNSTGVSALSPAALFLMGAAFCLVEITSAFPYFGFIAMLNGHTVSFITSVLFLLFYNFLYVLPLILVHLAYSHLRGTGTIRKIENIMETVSRFIVPAFLIIISVILFRYSQS